MQVSKFSFDLPDDLIARFPKEDRSSSRLMYLNGDTSELKHLGFKDVVSLLKQDDLLIFNNTKVIPARMFGQKSSGGKVEVLVERVLDEHSVLAHIRANKSPKPGNIILLEDKFEVEMIQRQGDLFELKFLSQSKVLDILDEIGHMPLPPYIDRPDNADDRKRYQTVYGEKPGAVAAPTAGLHFDENIMQAIKDKNIDTAFVTLHVGAGTFQPVRVDTIDEHVMHSEYIEVPEEVVEKINATKAKGGRVVAVGTTSVRSVESAAWKSSENALKPFYGDTDIFIYPGYEFKVVDAMITNFHLSESTLLMLVSAFSGYDNIINAYNVAVEEKYRFFSYGDAMFLEKKTTK